MNIQLFSIIYLIVTVTILTTSLLVAFFDRKKLFFLFSLSAFCSVLSIIFFVFPHEHDILLTIFISNLLLFFGVITLTSCIRSYFNHIVLFPKRFFFYFFILLGLLYMFHTISTNIYFKTLLLSILGVVLFIDLLISILPALSAIQNLSKCLLLTTLIISIFLVIIRSLVMISFLNTDDSINYLNDFIKNFLYISQTIITFLWFVTVLLLNSMNKNEKIKESRYFLEMILEHIPIGIWIKNKDSEYLYQNLYADSHFALTESEKQYCKKTDQYVYNNKGTHHFEEHITFTDNKVHTLEIIKTVITRKGHSEPELLGIGMDITNQKEKEEEIQFITFHDTLTGMWNQNQLHLMCDISSPDSYSSNETSIIFLNIDDFRLINDSYGHRTGDKMLLKIRNILNSTIETYNAPSIPYRYGGDEFVIIINSTNTEFIKKFSESLLHNIKHQIILDNRMLFITASIGIYIGGDSITMEEAIKHADTAMYVAKKKKNCISFYENGMEKIKTREKILEEDLQYAIQNNELELFYQPIVDLHTGTITQAEVLLRWHHKDYGMISPGEFIPIAESTRLIIPISEWVISKTCEKLSQWKDQHMISLVLSINLSMENLETQSFELAQNIKRILYKYDIAPGDLKLEITESILMHFPEKVIETFNELRTLGLKLVLDDFGTGYSSFGYITDLPIDTLKIDRSMIMNITKNERVKKLVDSIIKISHDLELDIVAEGVEYVDELKILNDFHCDYIQGFLFSRPLNETDFLNYLKAKKKENNIISSLIK